MNGTKIIRKKIIKIFLLIKGRDHHHGNAMIGMYRLNSLWAFKRNYCWLRPIGITLVPQPPTPATTPGIHFTIYGKRHEKWVWFEWAWSTQLTGTHL